MPGSTVKNDIKKLYSLLRDSLPAEHFFLRRDIERLRRASARDEGHEKFQKQLTGLEKKIRGSIRKKRWRIENRPRFDFDPALPITARKDDIITAIQQNPVVVISGETGSGKTTQIPKFCLAAGRGIAGKIGCTQPRRIAATSVARRIADELGEELGRSVGYKIRFKDRTRPDTYIKIMTDGILLAEAQGDPYLNDYDTIIVDEAHERSLNIDFVLGIVKTLQRKRRDLKIIITSATIDTEKFSRAFDGAPIIEVSGRMYPVQVKYAGDDPAAAGSPNGGKDDPTYVEMAVAAVRQIIAGGSRGDILVFMPTEQDIRETCDLLVGTENLRSAILPLFARLSAREQRRVFAPAAGRKVIVATNVAETSLTIPGIRYVVDTGLARIPRYNPRSRTTALPVVPISISSADQRKGRCGRVENGVCVRLFSEDDLKERAVFTPPEIVRSNLAEVILRMMALKLGDISDFPFIDPPAAKSIKDGYALLKELGAITQSAERGAQSAKGRAQGDDGGTGGRDSGLPGYRLTSMGRLMARLPIDPRLSRMLLAARTFGCVKEMTIIAAALSIQDPRERPSEVAKDADQIHAQFADQSSDFLTLLKIWSRYREIHRRKKSNNQVRKFCKSHYLSYRRMREWQDIRTQINEILKENKIGGDGQRPRTPEDRYAAIHKSLLSGFLSNIALKKEKNIFQATRGRQVMIFPGSSIFNNAGTWVVAAEVVETSRLFARVVANIEDGWLEEIGRDMCRYTYGHPHWSRKRGEVVASEQVSLFGLTVVAQRTVSYGRINPEEAAEIFIREALVADDLKESFPFLSHNREIIAEVRDIENRIRRRDVFVGEEEIYRFYRKRLDRVRDVRSLGKLLKQKGSDLFLRLKKPDLMRYAPVDEMLAQFPDRVQMGGNSFECDYCFDPTAAEDGLTVKIPSTATPLVPEKSVDWLVPGLLEEKITALIKGLPKKYRIKLLPLADTSKLITAEMAESDGLLLTSLAGLIYRHYGVDIPATAWDVESLPDHLQMRIAITDPSGEVIRSSRDRSILRQSHSGGLHLEQLEAAKKKWEKTGITQWDIGDLPDSLALEINDAADWFVYPALAVAENDKRRVDLRIFQHRGKALESHQEGVYALYCLHFSQDIRFLKKNILLPNDLHPAAEYFGGFRKVEKQLVDCLLRRLFLKNIRAERAFRAHAEIVDPEIIPEGRRLLEQIQPVLKGYLSTRSTIYQLEASNRYSDSFVSFFNRLKEDMTRLVPDNFFCLYDPEQFAHLPRYLKAVAVRAERASVDFEKDKEKAATVTRFTERLDAMLKELSPAVSEEKRIALEDFFWLLEEYKVSLFAQELGTAVAVSAKRLEKRMGDIERMV